jgi:hypothetical protein
VQFKVQQFEVMAGLIPAIYLTVDARIESAHDAKKPALALDPRVDARKSPDLFRGTGMTEGTCSKNRRHG